MIANAARAKVAPPTYARTTDDGGHWLQSVAMMQLHDAKVTALDSALMWGGNADNASVRGRATFLNKLEHFIAHAVPDKSAPLTMISHGSFGLLMEDIAHKALLRRGFSNIRWRCIDPLYDASIASAKLGFALTQRASEAFARTKTDVKFFATESEYLHDGGTPSIAERDRSAGTTMLMAIAPEIDYDPRANQPGKRSLGGVVVNHAAKANTAYLFYGPSDDTLQRNFVNMREMLRAGYATWRDANWMVEATITPDESLAVDRSMRPLENAAQRDIAALLEHKVKYANARAAASGSMQIEKRLQQAVRRTAREIETMRPPAGSEHAALRVSTMTLMLNQPAVALARLYAFLQRGEQPAFAAELVHDRVTIG